ncbi:MAG: sigma-70 family RNA polymerase sigma factor [Cytophagales bacterium]|nr:sigma-70 family RNA polymerase sigma factor [Cytophagales bacterium]MCA6387240.1 sigma-70 family RNA polymerase sigma factor [Cytophagales bacterium]MCA6392632.1 sigma-70 family RNA polymerase sigma factor [Cytophagales bacterium]MCA6395792.1 sigma-70 family RNA polymerase sigma factor [Cytophagales bacterium]MCA6398732.1 sigma-70 family RNA polymerase sigma factor [Cytophagales bacterium]
MPSHSHTDTELLRLYKESGELKYWGELYTRYTSLLYGVCLKYLKDRDEAKDAMMQLFEKLVTTLLTHDVENFKSWLYVTARNHCLMQLRAQNAKPSFRGFTEGKQGFSPEFVENQFLLHLDEEPEMEQNLSKLEKCIDKLDNDQQLCVRLFYLQERCYKDVTGLTGFDLNKVKSYIQNGKRNLKICMEQNE